MAAVDSRWRGRWPVERRFWEESEEAVSVDARSILVHFLSAFERSFLVPSQWLRAEIWLRSAVYYYKTTVTVVAFPVVILLSFQWKLKTKIGKVKFLNRF
jgi:hypothetical protein